MQPLTLRSCQCEVKQRLRPRWLTAVTPDALVPQGHPIRRIKPTVDSALAALSPTFSRMYALVGRPSIPPEHLLKGCLLMALFSVRSERQLCERLEYDMLFKWFLDMNILDASFNHSVFSKNKERLLKPDVSREFFKEIVDQARDRWLLSDEHFSVDGTLQNAWASIKSFRPKGNTVRHRGTADAIVRSTFVVRRVFDRIRSRAKSKEEVGLTLREKEILASFCRGMSYVAIAEAREVKVVTIRNAIYTIQVKLGVASKQEVVVWAVRNGLLDD